MLIQALTYLYESRENLPKKINIKAMGADAALGTLLLVIGIAAKSTACGLVGGLYLGTSLAYGCFLYKSLKSEEN